MVFSHQVVLFSGKGLIEGPTRVDMGPASWTCPNPGVAGVARNMLAVITDHQPLRIHTEELPARADED
jgi:hypothetical protein